MQKPISIIWFERCYLAAIAVSVINTLLNWSMNQAVLRAQGLPGWVQPLLVLVSIVVQLLLWFLIVKRGNAVARAITILINLAIIATTLTGGLAADATTVLSLVEAALFAAATVMLLRRDTRAWNPAVEPEGVA